MVLLSSDFLAAPSLLLMLCADWLEALFDVHGMWAKPGPVPRMMAMQVFCAPVLHAGGHVTEDRSRTLRPVLLDGAFDLRSRLPRDQGQAKWRSW